MRWKRNASNLATTDIENDTTDQFFLHINFAGLLHLDMSNNALAKIPARTFDGYSSLYWLELASNQISTLGDDAFKGEKVVKR